MRSNTLKERFVSRCATFSKATTFHGFLEFHQSKRWYEKCAWIFVMLGCTGMLCFNLAMQIDQYLDVTEVVTRSTRLRDDDQPYDFPNIVLFLSEPIWIDTSKVKSLGFTYEEVITALAYLRPTVDSKILEYESDISVETAKETLRSKMDNHRRSGISELLSNITWVDLDGLHNTGLTNRTSFYREGAFYILNTKSAKKTEYSKTWKYQLRFDFASFLENANKTLEFLKMSESTTLSTPIVLNPDTEQELPLYPNQKYMISVHCGMYRRLHGCRDTAHPHYYQATCKLDCRLEAARETYTCVSANDSRDGEMFELSKSFRKGLVNLCHLGVLANGSVQGVDIPEERILSEIEKRERDKAVTDCEKECMPKCQRLTSSWSVITFPCSPIEECSEAALVTAVFPDTESMVITEEIERYKWHDVVSNIGGLLGLWLGASIMTIFQAMHLCCCWEDEASEAKKKGCDTVKIAV